MDPTQTVAVKPQPPSIFKRFFNKIGVTVKSKVTIYNNSDTLAYVMISDTPLHHVSAVGAGDVSVNRELVGEYKSQCTYLAAGSKRKFEVFTDKIYYSVYFKLPDGTELFHTKDRLHNALKKDINILQRHVQESQPGNIP